MDHKMEDAQPDIAIRLTHDQALGAARALMANHGSYSGASAALAELLLALASTGAVKVG
jgi:cysteine synthase